ncbi:acyl-CoA thioester hydrolase/BAAT C-terminal domain-containing protein [Microbispora sp. NPDC046933]|uniref:acyl-CoA thioester hydrolase/BAAT C-terminal domain-containing protein n=1 Tax=Microbispora sp. NPDC046933 TaxID=3155618 RepID=UPI0033EBE919
MGSTGPRRTEVREKGLVGVLFSPPSEGPHPTVIVLGGSEGGVPERAAAALAGEGFAAMATAYFGVDPLPRHLVEIPLEYFAGVIEWLRGREEVDRRRLGVLGRSRGGELALLLASTYPDAIGAVAAYVASGVVWQATPADPAAMPSAPRSSWTLGGRPVPFVPAARPTAAEGAVFLSFLRGEPVAFRPFFERAMGQREAVAAAAIAVEKINGPVLLLSGGADRLWPSGDFAEAVMRRLADYGHPFPYRHLHYAEAGHLIGVPGTMYGPGGHRFGPILMGGGREPDEAASRDAWPTVVSFLRTALRAAA